MAIDKALVYRGSLAPRHLREYEISGLVDTGELTLVVPPNLVQQLGLKIQRQQISQYANGYEESVGGTHYHCLQGGHTTLEALVVGDEVLIGQVVLELLDLLPDCKNQRLIPNPANPDYPISMIKSLSEKSVRVRLNPMLI